LVGRLVSDSGLGADLFTRQEDWQKFGLDSWQPERETSGVGGVNLDIDTKRNNVHRNLLPCV